MKDYILDSELLSEKTTKAYNILSDILPILNDIEEISREAFAEINAHDELGYEDYTSIKSNMDHIEEYRDKYKEFGAIGGSGDSYNYKCKDMTGVCYNGFIGEYQSEVDDIFYYDQENTLKNLRDSKLQDIYVENNVGIISPAMDMGFKTATSIYKDKLNIFDLLGYGRVSIAMQKEYANMKAKIDNYNASMPNYSIEHTSKHLSDYIEEILFGTQTAEAIDKLIFDAEINKQKIHNIDDYINKMVTSADFDFETNDEKVLSTLGYFVPGYGEYQILNEIIAGQNPISGKHYGIKDRLDMIAALGVGCAIGKVCKVAFAEIAGKNMPKLGGEAELAGTGEIQKLENSIADTSVGKVDGIAEATSNAEMGLGKKESGSLPSKLEVPEINTIEGSSPKVITEAEELLATGTDGKLSETIVSSKNVISELSGIEKQEKIIAEKITGEGAGNPLKNYSVEDFTEEMTKLPHAEISTEIRDEIIRIPKGQKPDPSVYMSSSEIKEHLSLFDDGVVRIQSKESFEKAMNLYGSNIGDPATGTFVLPKSIVNKAIEASNGNPRILEELLALDPGYLGEHPIILDINNPSNIRIPSGNEAGAWREYWIPGGYTGGGVPEAVIDQIPSGGYTISSVYPN